MRGRVRLPRLHRCTACAAPVRDVFTALCDRCSIARPVR